MFLQPLLLECYVSSVEIKQTRQNFTQCVRFLLVCKDVLTLWVSYDCQNKQFFIPKQHLPIIICYGDCLFSVRWKLINME